MPALDSLWQRNFALLEPTWEQVKASLGDTCTVFPLVGLGSDGRPDAASFKTRRRTASGLEAVVTWQAGEGGPANWTNGNDFTRQGRWQGIVPIVNFDGVDDMASTPDNDYWSAGADGTPGNEPTLSLGAWIWVKDTSTDRTILAKFDDVAGNREWFVSVSPTDILDLNLTDDSVAGNPSIKTRQPSFPLEQWIFLVVTYDGSTHPSGMNVYNNGVLHTSDDQDNEDYVALENKGALVRLGSQRVGATKLFSGYMAGGPLGPFFTQKVVTPAEVKHLYHSGRAKMNLGV